MALSALVRVNEEKCVGCGVCVKSCPEPGAIACGGSDAGIACGGKRRVSIDAALCKMCLLCVSVCPKKAIAAED